MNERSYAATQLLPGSFAQSPDGGCDLIGSRCDRCGLTTFPRIGVCPRCRVGDAMAALPMGRRAKLYSHAIAHVAPAGFEAPYYQAFVVLDEGPRVFTLISHDVPVQPGILHDGCEMELLIERAARSGELAKLDTYKYRPVAGRNRGAA